MISINIQQTPLIVNSSFIRKMPVDTMTPLCIDYQPNSTDIICGRGNAVKLHSGNIRFLQIVNDHLKKYSIASSKLERSMIVSDVVELCHFIKKIGGVWHTCDDQTAREKVGQRLRDLLHSKYSSSSKSKRCRRRANEANLANRVDELVARSNGMTFTDRIQALTTARNAQSDEDFQRIFIQANIELLRNIKQGESDSDDSDRSVSSSSSSDGEFF